MYNAESVWEPSIHVNGLWDSKKWRKCKAALTFFEFCSFGEHEKPEPEQGSMARAEQMTSQVMDVREGPLWNYKKYQFLNNVRYPCQKSFGGEGILREAKDGSRWWQEPETFGLFLLL